MRFNNAYFALTWIALMSCITGCATKQPVKGGWLGAESVRHYRLGEWDPGQVGTLFRVKSGEKIVLGDLIWRSKASTEEDVLKAYSNWIKRASTSEPLSISGRTRELDNLLPLASGKSIAIRVVARNRHAEMFNDLMQLQAFLNDSDFPDARIEAVKEQMLEERDAAFYVCCLREWCTDLVVEIQFKERASRDEANAIMDDISRALTINGGVKRRMSVFNDDEHIARAEFSGKIMLRQRNVRVNIGNSGKVTLGEIAD